MRKNKIPISKVQEAFNAAIRRRDGSCMIRDYEPCEGGLECSHFYSVGSAPSLRFYPPNAWTQCARHHWRHHNVWEELDPWSYSRFMFAVNGVEDMCNIECLRHRYIKYTDELKAEIIRLCNADRLDELKTLIEEELK